MLWYSVQCRYTETIECALLTVQCAIGYVLPNAGFLLFSLLIMHQTPLLAISLLILILLF